MSRLRNPERGAAAVEFALILPVLILLIVGMLEFSRAYNAQLSLTNAAREGARVMAVDVANALDRSPARGWVDAIAAGDDEIAFKTALQRHPAGFFVLAAPPSPEAADAITAEQVSAVLARLVGIVRYVVVDTTPGVGESSLAVLEAADQAVFVSSLSVSSLRALRTELEVLGRGRLLPGRRHVVVNFVDRTSGLTVRDAERITGETVGVPIPRSSAVVLASNHGVPLLEHDPKDAAAKALLDLLIAVAPAAEAVARPARRRIR